MLPYQTLEEAQNALGRGLSSAETLWFNYSATQSDYLLYAHNFLFLICAYTLVPLPLALLQLGRVKIVEKYKLQPKAKASYEDMLKCYKTSIRVYVFVVIPIIILTYPATKWLGIRTTLPLPSLGEVFSQLLVYFLVEDYVHYWNHRFLHTKWGYENIHKIHHEFNAPFGFEAPYAHWAEISIQGFMLVIGPVLVPCHMITFWLWIALWHIEDINAHCGYEFPWNPIKYIPFYGGTGFHDYHHFVGEKSQTNFASVFTYCDYIYGTNKGYRFHNQNIEKKKNHNCD